MVSRFVICPDAVIMLKDMMLLYELQYNPDKNEDKSHNYALKVGNNKELTVDLFHTKDLGHTPDDDEIQRQLSEMESERGIPSNSGLTHRREVKHAKAEL